MNTALLTIDDFSSKNTPAVVDYLKEKGIKFIFFAEGRKVEQFYEEAKYALKNGVIIGNASTSGSKYTIDSSVVLVTYGEDMNTPYKSLILNFNDYAVQVTVNGVTYTVGGYEYIILMHN